MTAMFEVDPAGYRAQMAEMKPVKVIFMGVIGKYTNAVKSIQPCQ